MNHRPRPWPFLGTGHSWGAPMARNGEAAGIDVGRGTTQETTGPWRLMGSPMDSPAAEGCAAAERGRDHAGQTARLVEGK